MSAFIWRAECNHEVGDPESDRPGPSLGRPTRQEQSINSRPRLTHGSQSPDPTGCHPRVDLRLDGVSLSPPIPIASNERGSSAGFGKPIERL
jgi:hypothetical protein